MDDDQNGDDRQARRVALTELAAAALDAAGVPVSLARPLVRAVVGSSPEERVEKADAQLARDRSHLVPELAESIDVMKAEVESLRNQLGALHRQEQSRRFDSVASELRRLVSEGKVSAADISDDTALQEALLETIRRSLDAVDPSAVPFLVRLAAIRRGPPDFTFRSLARAVSDMNSAEVLALSRLACFIAPHPPLPDCPRDFVRVIVSTINGLTDQETTRTTITTGGHNLQFDLVPPDVLVSIAARMEVHGAAGRPSGVTFDTNPTDVLVIGEHGARTLRAIGALF